MKLATLTCDGARTAALITGDQFTPLPGYGDVGEFLRAGAAASESTTRRPYDPHDLVQPIVSGAVFCVGLNYRTHILEMGRELPEHPTLFAKLPSALAGPYDDIQLPTASAAVDYEGELVVVIGRSGRDIPEEEAGDFIAGYTLMNDVSMRDWQYRTLQWFAGKNFERSTPVGPFVVTADEFEPAGAELVVTVNGEVRQRSPLADLLFGPERLVADISRITTLNAGDLIATGTPGGVGHGMKPERYLEDGDVVDVRVDGIGTLSNRFVAA
jgi:acylpyruvate hydrolase